MGRWALGQGRRAVSRGQTGQKQPWGGGARACAGAVWTDAAVAAGTQLPTATTQTQPAPQVLRLLQACSELPGTP